jgi:hypothetical protein
MDFPFLVEPPAASTDLRTWLHGNADQVGPILSSVGAILFRGFEVSGVDEFHDLARVALGDLMQYVEGASPRIPVGAGIYTSTEYSPDLTVALHNELSYSHRWPARVAFFCRRPAQRGGQTPIADSRKVFERLVKDDSTRLPTSVRYLRQMHDGKGFGVGWPTVFATHDPADVEAYCQQAHIQFEWLADGGLRTSQIRPAAILHPLTGARVWFNQAHQWHPSNSGAESEEVLRKLFGDALPMNSVHANGEEFDRSMLDTVRAAYHAEMVTYDWGPGDVIILDNMLTAHGRTPFSGPREVLVAMGEPVRLADVQQVESYG